MVLFPLQCTACRSIGIGLGRVKVSSLLPEQRIFSVEFPFHMAIERVGYIRMIQKIYHCSNNTKFHSNKRRTRTKRNLKEIIMTRHEENEHEFGSKSGASICNDHYDTATSPPKSSNTFFLPIALFFKETGEASNPSSFKTSRPVS